MIVADLSATVPSATCLAIALYPRPPTGACIPFGRSRTSRSVASPFRAPGPRSTRLPQIKQAAALANHDLGLLDRERTNAIVAACRGDSRRALHDQFVVDLIQGGAGTSTNMNANEVIANRALEFLGPERGAYLRLHPNEHVNMGQSTNDVYPTALKMAACWASSGWWTRWASCVRLRSEGRGVRATC